MRRFRHPIRVFLSIFAALIAVDLALLLSQRQLEARFRATLAQVFRTEVSIREVSLSLLDGLHVRGLVVHGPSGERAISIDEAEVGVDWRRLALSEVRIEWPALDIRIDEAGKVSLLEALDPALLSGGGGGVPQLPSLMVRVNHASLRLADASLLAPGQTIGVQDLSLVVKTRRDGLDVSGRLVDPIAKEVTFEAAIDLAKGTARVDADIRKARLAYGTDVKQRIPPMFWAAWELLQLHGTGDIDVHVRKEAGRGPSVRVDINVHDGGVCVRPFPYAAKDVQGTLRIEKDDGPVHVKFLELRGGREGGTFSAVGELQIMEKGQDDILDLRITAKNMPVDKQLVDALPAPVDEIVRSFDPSGRGDATVRVHGLLKQPGEEDEVNITIDGEARGVRARFDGFPVPVSLDGAFSLRDFRFSMDDWRGEAAGGLVSVRGSASPEDVNVRVEVTGAVADEGLESALLPRHAKIVRMIAPRGRVNARIDVVGERDPKEGMSPTFRARITAEPGLTARFADFPYPLSWRAGVVNISPRGAEIQGVRAGSVAPGSPLAVTVNGTIRADDVDGGGIEIFVDASRMPIDRLFREACAPGAATVVAQVGPEAGMIEELHVDAVVPRAGAALELTAEARIERAVIVPEAIDLPVHQLRGRVRIDPDRLSLHGIEGVIVDAPLRASGGIGLRAGVTDTAVVEVLGLELDGDVENELPPNLRPLFEMLRPAGRLDARVSLAGSGSDVAVSMRADWTRGGFLLSFFPLAATGLSGRVEASGDEVRVEDVRGRLGFGAIEAHGRVLLDPAGGAPSFSLAAKVTGLPLDARLVDAFPEPNRAAIQDLAWKGASDTDLRIHFDPRGAPGGLLSYAGETTLLSAGLDVGLAFEEIDGVVRWHGSWPLERHPFPELQGGIEVRRALWKGQAISRMTARFEASDRMLDVTGLRADVLGGVATGNFYLYTEAPRLWGCRISLVGGRVERWAEAKYSGAKKASGLLEAEIALGGINAGARPPMKGEGSLIVRDGRLFELPTFAGILSALSLEVTAQPVFDDARIDMVFERDRIRIPRMVFSSSAISFTGGGTWKDGNMNLRLTHEIGRDWFGRIPVFGAVWNFIKGNIIELEVTGPPDDPKVVPIPLKAITDSARALVELGRTDEEEERREPPKGEGGGK